MRTDAQLIELALTDADAFAELYRRHAEPLHRYLRSRVGADVALDLTAETFAQAALGLRRFRDEADGSAGPWLHGIARNLVGRYAEHRRIEATARRKLGLPVSTSDDEFAEVDDRAAAEGLGPALRQAVDALPPGQRDALELRVVQELPYDEVASSLRITDVAARLRVMRRRGDAVGRELIPEPTVVRSGPDWSELDLARTNDLFYAVHRLDFTDEVLDNTDGCFHALNLVEGDEVVVECDRGEHRLAYAESIVIPASVGPYGIRRLRGGDCKVIKALVP